MTLALRERRRALALGGVRSERLLLAFVCIAGGLLVVVLRSRLTFFNDDWYFLLQRPGVESHGGLDTLLAPHNGNIVVLTAAMYKVLVATFGLGPQLPFALVEGLAVALLGWLVFVLVDERLGPVAGLAAAAVVVFLGPAWEALLFFASISHPAALTFGVATLLALELDTSARNAVACALLVCAILLFTSAIAFIVGAAIVVLFVRRRLRQLWIPAVPAALFVLWWAFYGHRQSSDVTASHIEHLPHYVFDAVSAGLASATGMVHVSLPTVLSSGHLLTVLAALLLVVWLIRGGRPTRWALVLAGTAVSFWLLTGASAIPGRQAQASRYQVTSATLLILLAAELLRGIRIGRAGLAVLSVATVLVVTSNLVVMRNGYDFLRAESQTAKVDIGALEVAGHAARTGLRLTQLVAHDPFLSGVTADRYFAQTRAHGSPPFDGPDQIESASLPQRQAADSVLVAAYGFAPRPVTPGATGRRCASTLAGPGRAGPSLAIPAGQVVVRNPGAIPLVIALNRFAPDGFPLYFGFLAPRSSASLVIPRDAVALPWQLRVRTGPPTGAAVITVCSV